MPLLFLPDLEDLFFWTTEPVLPPRVSLPDAVPWTAVVVTPAGRRMVVGLRLPLLTMTAQLATVASHELEMLPASIATWTLASKLALELIARERVVPTIRDRDRHRQGQVEARWAVALSAEEDAAKVAALACSMPPAAHAVAVAAAEPCAVWAPDALLRAYLDAVADAIVRASSGTSVSSEVKIRERSSDIGAPRRSQLPSPATWIERWCRALSGADRSFVTQGFGERTVIDDLGQWCAPALGMRDRLRACFRLELPVAERDPFVLHFLLQAPDDPSLQVPAAAVWNTTGRTLGVLGRAFRDPQESLLEALGRAARLYRPLLSALTQSRPEALTLDAASAFSFLQEGAAQLADAGFGVIVPGELTATGQRRLRLRMRVGSKEKVAGAVEQMAGLDMEALLAVDWQAMIGEQALSTAELDALSRQKAPLVRFRGAWVAVDPHELSEIRKRIANGPTRLTLREAMRAALAGEAQPAAIATAGGAATAHGSSLAVTVSAVGDFAALLEQLRQGGGRALEPPSTLKATLRPYQQRGLHWLVTMSALGLGACLADDMGLGKTMQFLAFLLHRMRQQPADLRPSLLVAPTSVIGNWERELARFAPTLPVIVHIGSERRRNANDFPQQPGTLVLTTYGVLRRDVEWLGNVAWSVVALDEAQNIKNAASITARTARTLTATQRVALTGTPMENRLAELWSILEFVNPGLLGALETFRREFALPIERYGDDQAAARLRRIVGPFIMRRLKSDPAIIDDLPPKNEMTVVCTLTREQATLYKAVVDEELRRIDEAQGMERRGRVLALLLYTKQICNHPAHYLGESAPLVRRSGKLERMTEMLAEALACGDKSLVFTQFREMGELLVAHLQARLGCEALFLHGGTAKATRDTMVQRFQEEPRGPRVFVLSIKAGGTGLNLTAASHVFHYDRWWNPAVEDQATDRAWRIGQARRVQVHKLLCAGTVEEKIDRLLADKRALAAKVVGSGEQWITEMDTGALHELFALSAGALIAGDDADEETGSPPTPSRKTRAKRSSVARLSHVTEANP